MVLLSKQGFYDKHYACVLHTFNHDASYLAASGRKDCEESGLCM